MSVRVYRRLGVLIACQDTALQASLRDLLEQLWSHWQSSSLLFNVLVWFWVCYQLI